MSTNVSRTVLCTGAPGSQWSRVLRQLSTCAVVDRSDERPERTYNFARHFGNYFGPGMDFGAFFHELEAQGVTRAELLAELDRPFAEPAGHRYRLIKSHAFAYNLPHLSQLLPEAPKLLIWRDDQRCYDWWMEAGGFSIRYPRYTWYRDPQRMRARIAEENTGILRFAEAQGITLQPASLLDIARQLGLMQATDAVPADWRRPLEGGLLIGVQQPDSDRAAASP